MDNALQNILELSRDPMLAVADGKILLMNTAAKKVFPECRLGDGAAEYIPDLILFDQAESFLSSLLLRDVHYTVSAQRSGGVLYLSLAPEHSVPLLRGCLSDQLVCGMLSSLFNIGLSAERLRAAADMTDPGTRKYFGALFHNYYTLCRRIGNVSTLCALTEGDMDVLLRQTDLVTLCAQLADSVSLLTADKCARVEFVTELDALPACVDMPKVERLILNLLANSLQHTPQDGLVRLRLARSGSNALISVDDNGCGIPPAKLKNIFQSFRNRLDREALCAESGGGLGLGLCSIIAEKHGGTLILESREGEGTTVRVLLPLSRPGETKLETEQPEYHNGGMTLLLTELSELLDSSRYERGFPD